MTGPPDSPQGTDDLKTIPVAELEKRLGSSAEGLSQAEAAKRLLQHGPNEIAEKKSSPLLKLLAYRILDPLPATAHAMAALESPAG